MFKFCSRLTYQRIYRQIQLLVKVIQPTDIIIDGSMVYYVLSPNYRRIHPSVNSTFTSASKSVDKTNFQRHLFCR